MTEFRADLHIHSRFSRATSSRLNVLSLAAWAGVKGLAVLGSGDFTHPVWLAELEEYLEEDGQSGLLRLRDKGAVGKALPEYGAAALGGETLFMLQGEISSIYKRGGKVRKVHNLVYMPDFASARKFCAKLERIGNLKSDGRPILGLDSRNLLELVLEAHPLAFLIPAHIWTPWFSLFGSKSGFDKLEDCFGDLSEHVFALETGLSSDPEMNRLWSALDRYKLVSNSDAHSGENLGREANVFAGQASYEGILRALKRDGEGTVYRGTLEFFPEEGKYHLDGHRACNVALSPAETRKLNGICPVCGKPLTVGVLNRVEALADRESPVYGAEERFASLIPLPEILGEILNAGSKSRKVADMYGEVLKRFGPELNILAEVPEADLARYFAPLGEAVARMRRGQVRRQAGYDGEYGVIRVFSKEERGELKQGARLPLTRSLTLNGMALDEIPKKRASRKDADGEFIFSDGEEPGKSVEEATAQAVQGPVENADAEAVPAGLNASQERAVLAGPGPVLVLAGPGTGKTRTLIARIAHLLDEGISPRRILAVTFTRRAAGELDQRLAEALGGKNAALPRTDTLHALALELWLRVQGSSPVLLSEESARLVFEEANAEEPEDKVKEAWAVLNLAREKLEALPEQFKILAERYSTQKTSWNQADYTDLLELWLEQAQNPAFSPPWSQILVDEVQDLSPLQLSLLRHLSGHTGEGFFAIGDPDQSIYGFRGAHGNAPDFLRQSWPGLETISLDLNYRSVPKILRAAGAVLAGPPGRAPLNGVVRMPGLIQTFAAPSAESEAAWLAWQVKNLLGTGSHSLEDHRKGGLERDLLPESLSPGDIAVLVRLKTLMPPLQRALERAGVPCGVPATEAFWEDSRVARILRSAGRVLGIGGLGVPTDRDGGERDDGPLECPDKILARGPLHIAAYFDKHPFFDAQFWKSSAFRELLRSFERHKGWPGLINWINLQNELELVRAKSEKVQIMSLHAAKGLEFRVVFMPAAEDGLLPFAGALTLTGRMEKRHTRPDPEEERRLFYVGVTRAKEALFLSHAAKRRLYGREMRLKPSRFLAALPSDDLSRSALVQKVDRKEKQLGLL